MQKKLIVLAVAAAVATPMAASAAPTIYGKMHYSVDYVDTDDDGDDNDPVTGTSRASRLGFKGSEALGGSLKAIWQVEAQINAADNSDFGGDFDLRNTFVGLSGNWGTVLLGRHDTPYKIATGKLDTMSDRISDYNNIIGTTSASGTIFDERAPQTVAYISPNFNGFHVAAAHIEHKFNEETTADQTQFTNVSPGTPSNQIERGCRITTVGSTECKNDDENRAFSIMGMGESGNWFLSGAWERHEGQNFQLVTGQTGNPGQVDETTGAPIGRGPQTLGDDEIDAFKVGLGYKFGNWKFGLIGEMLDDNADDSANERNAYFGNISYKFGKNVIKAAVGFADDSDAENCTRRGSAGYGTGTEDCDDEAYNFSLALDHNFSRRTTIYAAFSAIDNDDDGQYGLTAGQQIGSSRGYRSNDPGDDPIGGSIGIIHKF